MEMEITIERLLANLAYLCLITVIVVRFNPIKKSLIRGKYTKMDYFILSLMFGMLGILGTYLGIDVQGAIANTRIMPILAGGILFGPIVGVAAGLIAAVHRVLLFPDGVTTFACFVSTILAGLIGGLIYQKNPVNKGVFGFASIIFIEAIEMLLIYATVADKEIANNIIQIIFLPMSISNAIGVVLILIIVKDIFAERDKVNAEQARKSLDIAKDTVNYFRKKEYENACRVIKEMVMADAVSLTDREKVIGHVGVGSDHHTAGSSIITESTRKAMELNKNIVLSTKPEIGCVKKDCPLKSAIIIPLTRDEDVVGTLKIYYTTENMVTSTTEELARGLGQLISNQMELAKIDELEGIALKSELKALQSQINPHFLFNTLNTVSYLTRTEPDKARELIANLSEYMRYNLDNGVRFVPIEKELEQVNVYYLIEKERFLDKFDITYDIDENLSIEIPSLIIQPLVENCIKHAFKNIEYKGEILLSVKNIDDNDVQITVEDNGEGISQQVINTIYASKKYSNRVGLFNVNDRLKILYNKGLEIERLDKGTRITFKVKRGVENELYHS